MILRVLFFFGALILAAQCDNSTDTKDGINGSSVTQNSTATIKPTTLPSLCDICNCTDRFVDCTKRGLDNHFEDSQWPKTNINEISFEENLLVRVKPFPALIINKLILRKNQIAKIDFIAFKPIINLTELDLSHNQLTSENMKPEVFEGKFSPESYAPLPKLVSLNLAGNDLHTLDEDLFEHIPGLKVLNLAGNPLSVIDHQTVLAISNLFSLEEIDLSYCRLREIPKTIFHVPRKLRRLNLTGNQLTVVPNLLEDTPSLEFLRLDENPITSISMPNGEFPAMLKMKELSICDMPKLSFIGPGAFSKLTGLESLRIQNCPHLRKIDEQALKTANDTAWPPLKKLDISDNALQYLPSVLVGRWDKLEELDLMNNEWSCDCDNQYLINILLPTQGTKLMGDEVDELKCATPPEHAGKNLTSLSSRHIRCLDKYDAQPEKDAAVLVGMLIGLLLALPIALAIFILWQRGYLFCGRQTPASFSRAFYKRTPHDDDI